MDSKSVTQTSTPEVAITRRGVQEVSPALGHASQGPYWAPSDHVDSDELLNVESDIPLRSDYEQVMTHATHADKEYQRELRSLFQTFPQDDGEVPTRPTPERMQVLFKKVLYHDQARPRGKGSKGGVKHYECKWPACPFKGPLQKCMDHFFCEHVKLKFFKCEQPNCEIMFLRKYDLEKHKQKQHPLLRPREQRSQGDRGVAGPSRQTRSCGPIQHQPYSTQGRSTRRHAIESSQGDSTGTAGLTQTKPSGPLGQFQVCLVKPLARFLTMPYVYAQHVLQLSRTVHVFHMQSVYIARQAIHLVILLNDLVDAKEGPDDEQYQERIDLEDELIELFDAMQEWGANPDEGLQVDYEQGLLKIDQQYAQFFRERFYFDDVRNSADDSIYRKLVAYDRKTIDFRKWQYSRPESTSMDVDPNGYKTRDEGDAGHGSEAYIESVTSSPESSGIGSFTGKERFMQPIDESSAVETRWVVPDTPITESDVSAAATSLEPNPDAGLLPLTTAINSQLFGVDLTPSLDKPVLNPPIQPPSPKDPPPRLYSALPASDYYGAPASFHSGSVSDDTYGPWDGPSSLYDPKARPSPGSNFHSPSDFGDFGFPEGKVVAIESSPTASSVRPPEFRPVLEGRLFTAHDSIIEAHEEVHPTARLLYDSLPQHYREIFKNCPMYHEKHLEFVKYLRYLSLNDLDKKNEPSSEKNLIKTLGISVSTEEGDKKKWQCGVVGCNYRGTLQHLVSHLRTKSHIGIPTFACTLDCKILFHHSQDRDLHVKEKTCLKSRPVEDSPDPQRWTGSLRGARDQVAPATKPKIKSRANHHLEREYQIPAQTSAQGVNDPRTSNYDPSFQRPGNGMPSISFVPPHQTFGTPPHLTNAYMHSNVPTTQDRHAGMHPPPHPVLTPNLFRTPSTLPMNNGGMHASVITNNNQINNTMGNFQPTNNPRFTPASEPFNPQFNNPTGLTYAYPGFDPRVSTGYQDPGRSSTSNFANFAGDFYVGYPPQGYYRNPRDSRLPPPYVGTSNRPEAWGVTGIEEEGIKEEEEEMRLDSGVFIMDE